METKAVLFDYGGTLDSDGLTWLERFSTLYREHGVDTESEPFRRAFYDADDHLPLRFDLRGLDLERTLALQVGCVCRTLGQSSALAEQVAGAFLSSCRSFFKRNLPLLVSLRSRYKLGIVSNFYGNLDSILAGEGLRDLFDVVSESEKVGVTKPEPGIFLHAVNSLGCAPREALMVGDSVRRDMRGAEGLGMPHAWLAGERGSGGRCCGQATVLKSLVDLGPLLLGEGPLRAGIIAAGEGSRMRGSHPAVPKPLVRVAGKPLVHWVVEGLKAAGVRSIVILLNTSGDPVRGYLESAFPDLSWTFLREDTASSWESFRLVSRRLAVSSERFLISTVDALIPPPDVARFARESFAGAEADAVAALAVTPFVDDEKPLWADLDEGGRVSALGSRSSQRRCVTCGLYALRRPTALAMPPAAAHARLRDYWAALVDGGARVRGVLLGKTIDVDRPQDLGAAEEAVRGFERVIDHA